MSAPADVESLREVARLFGGLLLWEIDDARLAQLRAPEVAETLRGMGVVLPVARDGEDLVEELAAQFCERVLQPRAGAPLVASLWAEERFEGEAAVAVRALADAAGFEYDRAVARGAPVDHLGTLLLLWAEAAGGAPPVAEALTRDHLAWAAEPLRRLGEGGDAFYPSLARAVSRFLETITRAARDTADEPR